MGGLIGDPVATARGSDTALNSLINFGGRQAQVFANVKIHAIDFSQESTSRGPIVFRVGLDLPNLFDLVMELSNPIQRYLKFFIVVNH